MGHNIVGDIRVLNRVGLLEEFDLIEVADTQGLVQDTNNDRLPQGLPDLVLQFKLFPSVYSRRKRSWRGGLVFLGAHDAGNDAIANLKL